MSDPIQPKVVKVYDDFFFESKGRDAMSKIDNEACHKIAVRTMLNWIAHQFADLQQRTENQHALLVEQAQGIEDLSKEILELREENREMRERVEFLEKPRNPFEIAKSIACTDCGKDPYPEGHIH